MREKIRGLLAALLCVGTIGFGLSGCAKEQPLYTAGLQSETEITTGSTEVQSGTDGAVIDGETSIAEDSGDTASATEDVSGSMVSASADASGDATSVSAENAADGSDSPDDSDTLVSPGTFGDTSEAAQTEAAVIGYVYVCGAVNEAGVYPIREDMRVCDAIALAGGFSEDADDEWLNQAATVYDGQKLYVYTVEETDLMKEAGMSAEGMDGTASGSVAGGTDTADGSTSAGSGLASTGSSTAEGTAGSAALAGSGSVNGTADGSASAAGSDGSGTVESSDGKVNLNTATREELMTLPGIGESKADAILAYRSEHGAFTSIEEIQNISGIKSGVFSKIKDLITV